LGLGDTKINSFLDTVLANNFAKILTIQTEKAHDLLALVYAIPFSGS